MIPAGAPVRPMSHIGPRMLILVAYRRPEMVGSRDAELIGQPLGLQAAKYKLFTVLY